MKVWNIIGWVVLVLIVLAVLGALFAPSTVTTDCTYNYTSCTTTVR
jgi:hypothetical protein